jgi:transposase InsO family protein
VVFFAFVIDVFSRRIVGWRFAAHMRTTLVLDALQMALSQRGGGADVALVHHTPELRRPVQDRADRRPRLAHSHPARAGDRRVRRLVQHRPATRVARRPPPAEFKALHAPQFEPSTPTIKIALRRDLAQPPETAHPLDR